MLFFSCFTENIAQSYLRIEYPYVGYSTESSVRIKCIEFTEYQTRIDFIASHTGRYIYLENPTQRNAMYIKIGNRKYRLRSTSGIASTDGITYCQPGQSLEFTAFFNKIPDNERDNFDLIEGVDGTWNFFNVSINKHKGNKANFEETIEYPYVERQSHPYIIITKIERLADCTKIYFNYKTPYKNGGWMSFNKNTYIRTLNGDKYDILYSEGIPLLPDAYNFKKLGQSVAFCLVFPKLPNDVNIFSLYEPVSNGFIFYNVKLHSDYERYLKKCDDMELYFKGIDKNKTSSKVPKANRKKLKKNPNFKID